MKDLIEKLAQADGPRRGLSWRMKLRRWRRRYFGNHLIADLRFIQWEHRMKYRHWFDRGTVGHCLGALLAAQRNGHLRCQRPAILRAERNEP